ncbi:hypothetical protein D3C72_767490 [compost metagenome]
MFTTEGVTTPAAGVPAQGVEVVIVPYTSRLFSWNVPYLVAVLYGNTATSKVPVMPFTVGFAPFRVKSHTLEFAPQLPPLLCTTSRFSSIHGPPFTR